MDSTMEGLKHLMNELYLSGKYSDLKIYSGESVFAVHRAIVCTQSEVLETMTVCHKKYSPKRYLTAYKIHLDDEQPMVIAALIKYLYTHDYDDHGQIPFDNTIRATSSSSPSLTDDSDTPISNADDSASSTSTVESSTSDLDEELSKNQIHPILFNMLVNILAKKYCVKGLQNLSTKKYNTALEKEWDADNFTQSLEIYAKSANLVEDEEPLKAITQTIAHEHIEDLLITKSFETLLCQNGHLAFSMLKTAVKANKAVQAEPSRNPDPFPEALCAAEPISSVTQNLECTAPANDADDPFRGISTKKEKKKCKKNVPVPDPEEPAIVETWSFDPPAPVAEDTERVEVIDDGWGATTSKKDKKKKKMAVIEEPAVVDTLGLAIPEAPVPEVDENFAFSTSKKDKKKKKVAVEEPAAVETWGLAPPEVSEVPEAPVDDGWGFSTSKKDKKKKGVVEEPAVLGTWGTWGLVTPGEPLAPPASEVNESWGFGIPQISKKKKGKKAACISEPEPVPDPEPVAEYPLY